MRSNPAKHNKTYNYCNYCTFTRRDSEAHETSTTVHGANLICKYWAEQPGMYDDLA